VWCFVAETISGNRRVYNPNAVNGFISKKAAIKSQVTSALPILNTNFKSYNALRGIILDKIDEVISTFNSQNSSINRGINQIDSRFGRNHSNKFKKIIDTIYKNCDQIISSDKIDSDEYFSGLKDLQKNLNSFQHEMLTYLYKSDIVDASHPQEAYDNINRLYEDILILNERENSFSKRLRYHYIDSFTKK
jgi:hypothetical protein